MRRLTLGDSILELDSIRKQTADFQKEPNNGKPRVWLDDTLTPSTINQYLIEGY